MSKKMMEKWLEVALAEKIHDVDWYTRLELAEDDAIAASPNSPPC